MRQPTGKIFFTWRTRKDGNTYTAIVLRCVSFTEKDEAGSFVDFETVKEVPGIKTRARAKGSAIRWRRWCISQEKKATK